jgi:integrase
MARHQNGYVYLANNAWHIRFYTNELRDGKLLRVQKSKRLCTKDRTHYSASCNAVQDMAEDFLRGQRVNTITVEDMPVSEFWENRFLPYCEEIVTMTGKPRKRPSTVYGYQQIWRQHLKEHFGSLTLQQYQPALGTQFLRTLTAKQGKNTLKHIKALGSSIFNLALEDERIKMNPWRNVLIPRDAVESKETEHYTLEQAEDMISALADHVDCQLILALSCFLGLRPGEIAGLKWEDFDGEWLHIRRNVVRGEIGEPKTKAAKAPVPLIDQVRVPLELYRQKCNNKTEGWMFRESGPLDSNNVLNRVILPHVKGLADCVVCKKRPEKSGVTWKGLYAGRRGACTMVIEATNGNYAVAQALLRHEKMTTTVNTYKKAITARAFKDGMLTYQKSLISHPE